MEKAMLAELEPEARDLFKALCEMDRGCLLLRHLFQRANALMTIDDIAYHLTEPNALVEASIHAMVKIGLAREVVLAGTTLFGLTKDRGTRHTIAELLRWQDHCHKRLAEIGRMVDGNTPIRIETRGGQP